MTFRRPFCEDKCKDWKSYGIVFGNYSLKFGRLKERQNQPAP